jgi:ribose transport system ATP-binding protein
MPEALLHEPLLEMTGVTKSFGGNCVLSNIDLALWPHEVHALVGENGAGKSTLMKILNGVYTRDSGSIRLGGSELRITSPHDARQAGIGMIFQEQILANDLTVAENIFLGMEPTRPSGLLDNRKLNALAREVLERHNFPILASARVSTLTRAQKQLVEIARALATTARVIVMDEPTAVLSQKESEELFRIIAELKAKGLAIVYISHRMEELERLADRVTILRDGKRVFSGEKKTIDANGIIRHMVGRDIHELYPELPAPTGETVLEVRDLTCGQEYRNISFALHRGEILGLAGLVGAGRTAVARGIFGLDPPTSGTISLRGKPVDFQATGEAIAAGIGYLTEDRKGVGILPDMAVTQNISIAALGSMSNGPVLDLADEARRCGELIGKLHIKMRTPSMPIGRLSGGNQQKALLARWLFAGSSILLLDEPTQGVDLGTRAEIYLLMKEIVANGGSILMISSDLPELLGMSHRIGVMRQGELVATLCAGGASGVTQEQVMQFAA